MKKIILPIFLLLVTQSAFANQPSSNDYDQAKQETSNKVHMTNELKSLSHGTDSYFRIFKRYPTSIRELHYVHPRLIKKDHCGEEVYGYKVSCYFFENGYKFVAYPVGLKNNNKSLKITNGGKLEEIPSEGKR